MLKLYDGAMAKAQNDALLFFEFDFSIGAVQKEKAAQRGVFYLNIWIKISGTQNAP